MREPVHTPPSVHRPSRRGFLRTAAAGAILAPLSPSTLARQPAPPEPPAGAARRERGSARNVIFMVADGMSAGTLTLADTLAHVRNGRSLRWVDLWNRPETRRASQATASADAFVTDSAAAASAWGIGERVNNTALNFTPDRRTPPPLMVRARGAGKATGLVTTTRVTHATPASFLANVASRDFEKEIAVQYMQRGFDVVLGGGSKYFTPEVLAAGAAPRIVRTREELLKASAPPGAGAPAAPGAPLLGLFAEEHMHYELDRPETEPTLAEMTGVALAALAAAPNGFVLQVEGGRVDQAAHANDPGGMLYDMLAFDDALGLVLDFAEKRTDTLVVITTDHGTANPGLTFYSRDGINRFSRVRTFSRSFEWIAEKVGALPAAGRAAAIPDLVRTATGISLNGDEVGIMTRFMKGERVSPFAASNTFVGVLGSLLANWTGVSFMSPNHTSDFVEVTAVGPGSAGLAPMIDNTELHGLVINALGIPARAG